MPGGKKVPKYENFQTSLSKVKVGDAITEAHNALMRLERISKRTEVMGLERDRLINALLKHREHLPQRTTFSGLAITHPDEHRKLVRILHDYTHFVSQLSPNARRVAEG